jgi:predicted ATPase/DNA-binding winged helix-turn-helix (wHTH) protein
MAIDTNFDRFRLLPALRQLLQDGRPVAIGSRAFDLLHALIEHRDRVVSKQELLDLVWPDVVVEEANLHVQVSALRKILGSNAIATIPGRGYRFVAPIQADATTPSPSGQPPAQPALPLPVAPLIGRDHELSALTDQVRQHPLVTVTGPGGIGKTRLALAAGHALAGDWPDGVAWIELVATRDRTQVMAAAADALQLAPGSAPDPTRLAAALGGKSMLLVLDNGEHVLDAIGELIQALRRTSPQVHVLLTSQEALHIAGEQTFAVPPLGLPTTGETADESFGAIRLFAERARAADSRFSVSPDNAVAVAEICRRLDGLPLAIELAAARVPLLGVHALHARLAQQLDLLSRGARDATPRHQTLRSALAWSHSLLNGHEQIVLRRLGVFVGGFTLELAESVAGGPGLDPPAVLDALSGLIDKSLVHVDPREPVRYRLLETMRLFALEQLDAAGERAATAERHARAVTALFERVDDSRFSDDGMATAADVTREVKPEIDNARAALAWAMHANEAALMAGLAGSAAAAFHAAGLVHAILPVLRACLPRLSEAAPSAQVNVLWRLGALGMFGGLPHEELHRIKVDAVERARRLGLRRRLQVCLAALGFTEARRGDAAAARRVIDEMAALERPSDPVYVRALALSVTMMLAQHEGDVDAVVDSLGRQRALLLGAPDERMPLMTCESNLALYLNVLGRHEEAARLGVALLSQPDLPATFVHASCVTVYALAGLGRTDEARRVVLERRREIAATPISAFSGEALAMVCLASHRLDDAVRIDAALEQRAAGGGSAVHPLTRAFRARLTAEVQAAGAPAADVQRWRREGALLSDAAAVDLALR